MVHWLDCSAGAKQSDFLPGGILAKEVGFSNQPVVTAIIVVLAMNCTSTSNNRNTRNSNKDGSRSQAITNCRAHAGHNYMLTGG